MLSGKGLSKVLVALQRSKPYFARHAYVQSAAAGNIALKAAVPAEPGTVKLYDQHLFLQCAGQSAADWPSKAEALPLLIRAFSALAKHKDGISGKVKVTAFVSPSAPTDAQSRPESGCSALLFPAGNFPARKYHWLVPAGTGTSTSYSRRQATWHSHTHGFEFIARPTTKPRTGIAAAMCVIMPMKGSHSVLFLQPGKICKAYIVSNIAQGWG
jgi:hypothetical protein